MFNSRSLIGKLWLFKGRGYFHTRAHIALSVIEAVCADKCIGPRAHQEGKECFPCYIYEIAHSSSKCGNGHGWFEKTENTYKVLENG